MESIEYEIPDVTVVNDFTVIYKSQEEREGQLHDSIIEIKTSKDQFLRKLRYFKSRTNEINHMRSILIEDRYPKEIFKDFISTLTTNKISLNDDNYSVLLHLCDKYQYPELQKQVLKFSSIRPDIQSAINEVLQSEENEEEENLKEEVIATHLDICLRNENMFKFPIQKLVRILNSPKRVLNDHHLLYEFVKKFIFELERKNTKNKNFDADVDNENVQLLMCSLDYSQMSIDELKEILNSERFTCPFNSCKGMKEKMSNFISEIENQEKKINSLICQIERQQEVFRKFEDEHRKQQEFLQSYELKMKNLEDLMMAKYKNEQVKQQKNNESQLNRIKELEEKVLKEQKDEHKLQTEKIKKLEEQIVSKYKEEQELQAVEIKKLEEQIVNKYKEEQELQAVKIKQIEKKIQLMTENPMEVQIALNVQSNQTIIGSISIDECGAILDKSRSKYLLSKDGSQKLGESSYKAGSQIENLMQEVKFVTEAGTYYLHALLTDFFGHGKEFVSQPVTTRGAIYKFEFTGRVQSVTLAAGSYKLEVWGAEGGKNGEFSNHSGKGGYSVGTLTLKKPTKLFIHVGECPNSMSGGWNGGGSGYKDSSRIAAGGGGSTDISLYGDEGSSNWNNPNHLYSRIIVAGAGGGSSHDKQYPNWYGGFGGGTSGQISGIGKKESEGTQTRAGNPYSRSEGQGFGVGGSYTLYASSGGGSGWYGGSASGGGSWGAGGSGGSGYVYNSSTASCYPSGCKLDSSFYLADSATISGDKEIPNPRNSSTETGHSGHGYARITPQ